MSISGTKKHTTRIFRFIKSLVISIVLVLLLALILLHIPAIQQIAARKITTYLSSKTNSIVTIDHVSFNILGDISVEGIQALDPDGNLVLRAESFRVEANLITLLLGEFHLDKVSFHGVEGYLVQTEAGLNIDYFIDAFQSEDTSTTEKIGKPFALRVDHIDLGDISIHYKSHPDSLNLSVQFADLAADQLEINTIPGSIEAHTLYIDSFDLDIISGLASSVQNARDSLSEDHSLAPSQLPEFNFGIGFPIDLHALELHNASVSYHVNDVLHTSHFDPNHLELNNIRISLTDLSMHEEALIVNIDTFSTMLPVVQHTVISGQLDANMTDLTVSNFIVRSANSNVDIDFVASYPFWPDLLHQIEEAESSLTLVGSLDPQDLSYFLKDSLMSYFDSWDRAEIDLQAKINNRTVRLDTYTVRVGDSKISVKGNFNNLQEGLQAVRWDELNAEITVGSAFHSTLLAIADSTNLPDSIHVHLTSSGTIDTFAFSALVSTNWGIVRANGGAGIKDESLYIDMDIDGEEVNLSTISRTDWLGKCNFSLHASGIIDPELSLMIDGNIRDISLLDQLICDIQLQSHVANDSVTASISILDSLYKLELYTDILMSDLIGVKADLIVKDFHLGTLLGRDSSSLISGSFIAEATFSDSSVNCILQGREFLMGTGERKYGIDSLDLDLKISPSASYVSFVSDDVTGNFNGNFDLREISELLDSIITENFRVKQNPIVENSNKSFDFQLRIRNDDLLQLAGVEFEKFDGATLSGHMDQKTHSLTVVVNTGRIEGMGISSDTISFIFFVNADELLSELNASNIEYDSIRFGDLSFKLFSDADTSGSALSLSNDSVVLIDLKARLAISDKGLEIYPDQLVIIDQPYHTSWESPVFVSRDSFNFDQLKIKNGSKTVSINGNENHFDIVLDNIRLTNLNHFFPRDSVLINSGRLNGNISYNKFQKLLDARIKIDSLSIFHSAMIYMDIEAHTTGSEVPFNIKLKSLENNIQVAGTYIFDSKLIDATLNLDLKDASHLEIATQHFLDKLDGSLSGTIHVVGPISNLDYSGILNINELQVVASGTGSTVNIYNQELTLTSSGMEFNDFTIFDQKDNPLVLNGAIKTDDFKSIEYDLNISTDNYILFEQPRRDENLVLQGVLAVASDIKLTGNQNDTYLDVKVTVLDTSNLTYIMPKRDLEFVSGEGIVQFIDPTEPIDSVAYILTPTFYDSLVSALPSLNLNAAITLEKNAVMKVIIDPLSGDYVEASGAAKLKLKLDRSGNLQLNGNYTITNGIYQLSFYGIAKKRFEIAPESQIQWNGDPTNGDLDILAIHRVKSSSTGLIGHEVGENEQSLYRRALNYMVGIVIRGTVEKPEVTFTLDLPEDDKINYPVLANKLSRLSQPEFESELNKQVFGLLVLGGFIPESSGADMGELAVATTISNSVSNILTSQLNRFINENVKGIEVDIGMHSYSEYSSGGGQTRTAMDFRVTKRMINDRLSFELGAEVDINTDQSGANTGQDSFRGDIAVIYDLTESGDKKIKVFNNETYDIIYHEIRNTGIAFILIKEFDRKKKNRKKRE